MIIDVHTHIVPEHFPPAGNRFAGNRWPCMDHIIYRIDPDAIDIE